MSVPRWLTQPLFDPAVEPTSTLRQNQANPKKKNPVFVIIVTSS